MYSRNAIQVLAALIILGEYKRLSLVSGTVDSDHFWELYKPTHWRVATTTKAAH